MLNLITSYSLVILYIIHLSRNALHALHLTYLSYLLSIMLKHVFVEVEVVFVNINLTCEEVSNSYHVSYKHLPSTPFTEEVVSIKYD